MESFVEEKFKFIVAIAVVIIAALIVAIIYLATRGVVQLSFIFHPKAGRVPTALLAPCFAQSRKPGRRSTCCYLILYSTRNNV